MRVEMDLRRSFAGIVVAFAALMLYAPLAGAEEKPSHPGAAPGVEAEAEDTYAAVTLDGETLFRVRGYSAYPAARRAQMISERIAAIAADRSVSPDSLAVIEEADRSRIVAGNQPIMTLFDFQAAAEAVPRQALASAFRTRIAEGIGAYRGDRDPRVLLNRAGYALGTTLAAVLLFLGLRRANRWLVAGFDRSLRPRIERFEAHAHRLVQAKQLLTVLRGLLTTLYVVPAFVLAYLWLDLVLNLFPWTRPLARRLTEIFLDPLRAMALGFLAILPDLVFLGILYLVARYLLKLIGLFFQAVERGSIRLANFEPEWAMPTYKLVRVLVVISGAGRCLSLHSRVGSDAFKGLSIFLGVDFLAGLLLPHR